MSLEVCYHCKGRGRRIEPMMGDVGPCLKCDGSGVPLVPVRKCEKCDGSGWRNIVIAIVECEACKGAGCVPTGHGV